MAKVGRNEPCPCGSNRKAKRCCGTARGPSERELARGELARHARAAVGALAPFDERELLELLRELPGLPALDLSLVAPLPELVTPEQAELQAAIRDDDPEKGEELLAALVAKVDGPELRARLARAVVELRCSRRLDPKLAATALLDLDSDSDLLVNASLLEAAALAAGATRTPGGLLLAAA